MAYLDEGAPDLLGETARFNWRMKLTRSFAAEQFARGLESWGWIGAAGKVPVFASAEGTFKLRRGYVI